MITYRTDADHLQAAAEARALPTLGTLAVARTSARSGGMTALAISKTGTLVRVGAHRMRREARRALKSAAAPSAPDLNAETIRAAAASLGVGVKPLPGGFLELSHAGAISYARGSDFAFESLIPWHLCGDKPLTSRILSKHGIPVPPFRSFGVGEYEDAVRFLRESPVPMVAKPARRTSGGEAVTLNLTTARALRWAFARACAVTGEVVLEAQVAGENVRVTILDRQVVGVVRRIPAYVVGDGHSSIATLVGAKNELWRSRSPQNRLLRAIEVDRDLRRVLSAGGRSLGSTPGSGETVYLREVSNADRGGEVEDLGGRIHEDHVRLALSAAEAMGPVLCGVDLIVRDVRAPAATTAVYVNEVNTTPALYVSNEPVEGAPSSSAAERILRHLFSIDG